MVLQNWVKYEGALIKFCMENLKCLRKENLLLND